MILIAGAFDDLVLPYLSNIFLEKPIPSMVVLYDKPKGYCFLEINTSPMFEYFDKVSQGKISKSIINYLLQVDT